MIQTYIGKYVVKLMFMFWILIYYFNKSKSAKIEKIDVLILAHNGWKIF